MKFKYICCIVALLFISFLDIRAQEQKPAITLSTFSQKINGKNYHVHIVQQGQTLFSIARAYGSRYQDAIIKTDIDKLSIGDTVWVPFLEQETNADDDPYYKYYEVQAGETLYGISRRFNLKEADIIALNPDLQTISLKTGQIIKIPQSQKETASLSPPKEQPIPPSVQVIDDVDIVNTETLNPILSNGKIKIKDLYDKSTVCLALIMPFYLDDASEISISKLDIEQKRKRNYKSFQFIQFYEGILIALDKLQKQGYKVKLYVYDVDENDSEGVKKVFARDEIKEVDFIITLLYQKAFETAASLAMNINTFIVNPLSNRPSIVENNPYVFKIHPSVESYATNTLSLIAANFTNPNVFLIHSNKPNETPIFNAFKTVFENQKGIPYTLFNWSTAGNSLVSYLKADKENIIISIYDDKDQRNKVFVTSLLNRLSSIKTNRPTLFGPSYWLESENIDFSYLQRVNFHFENNLYLDYLNPTHKVFIDLFKETYKTEPNAQLAGLGYDITLHFVMGLKSKGKSFWDNPNLQGQSDLLNPFYFKRGLPNNGFENSRIFFYKLQDYQIVPARRNSK